MLGRGPEANNQESILAFFEAYPSKTVHFINVPVQGYSIFRHKNQGTVLLRKPARKNPVIENTDLHLFLN